MLNSTVEQGFKQVLESIAAFYTHLKLNGDKVTTHPITVSFEDIKGTAFCSSDNCITLPLPLLEIFKNNNLPRLCVFYHELGHALESSNMFELIDKWKNITISSDQYDPKYLYLINWIEDFYTEELTIEHYPYLTDILKCLKLLPTKYDDKVIDKAFHYYYKYKKISPALNNTERIIFNDYLQSLLKMRRDKAFNKGPISLVNSNNINLRFIQTISAFHNWCVAKGIIPANVKLPPLKLPTNIITSNPQQGTDINTGQSAANQNVTTQTTNKNQQQDGSNGKGTEGSYSTHSNITGTSVKEVFPDLDLTTPIFIKELETEQRLIDRYISSYRVETEDQNLNGLFTSTYYETNIIAKPNIKNFFDMRRIEDRMLFLQPYKTYNNVSIYRDVSGSTHDSRFEVIDKVCKHLISNIPVDTHFYLYASGNISIVEVPYYKWDTPNKQPQEYKHNKDVQQLGGGTNSDAVADVISEQMDDKWLNIIVTDGDLTMLFRRKNIDSLLRNIAIISVGQDIINSSNNINPDHYVYVKDENDIHKITPMLLNFKESV